MYAHLASAVLLLASFNSVQAQGSQCYRKTNNDIQPQNSGWIACNNTATTSGGAELCCLKGSECGSDSICRSDSVKTGQSRWYVGACTDKNYNDPICREDCSQYKQTFITYDSSKWQCCGNSACDEGKNTAETFTAVSPSQWSPIAGNQKSTTTGGSSNNNNGSSDSLNLGEKIGIGVAAGVVVIALIAGALFWFRNGAKRSRQDHRGVRGRYEELTHQGGGGGAGAGRAMSPPRYGARGSSPQPYGRSTSPVPPLRAMEAQRGRSKSPAMNERTPLPTIIQPGHGDGPAAPDQISMLSREERD